MRDWMRNGPPPPGMGDRAWAAMVAVKYTILALLVLVIVAYVIVWGTA